MTDEERGKIMVWFYKKNGYIDINVDHNESDLKDLKRQYNEDPLNKPI